MEVKVLNLEGKEVSQATLPADIFEVEVNVGLMHQAYVRQMANARQGTHKVQTRSEVNRTKAKWYRQKGTGRARHGSRNAPIFVGGGVAHGPKPRSYEKDMPRKMRRLALRCTLSALVRDNQLVVVENLASDGKTKTMQAALNALAGEGGTALFLLASANPEVERSVRNLDNAMYLRADYLNVRDLLKHDKVIMPLDTLAHITKWLGTGK
jgi:large subunit ribosomal protein L4